MVVAAKLIDGKSIAGSAPGDHRRTGGGVYLEKGLLPPIWRPCLSAKTRPARFYVRNKQRMCEKVGFQSTLHKLDAQTPQNELLDLVEKLNADASVHGILVQLPLPQQIDETTVLDAVHPLKDVDCFHPENVGLLAQGRPRFSALHAGRLPASAA